MKRHIVVAVAAAVVLVSSAVTANATTGSGTASVGSVDVIVKGKRVIQTPVAQCVTSGGSVTNASKRIKLRGIAEYGDGTTKCAGDPATGRITVEASGSRFELNALLEHGGPRIRINDYLSTCATTLNGSVARIQFGGLVGVNAPKELAPNHEILVQGDRDGDPPLAKVILNEIIVPNPPDGSITQNLMHVIFSPQGGGPITGELVVGGVYCTPLV
jgi:hypothetical protein